MTTSQHQAKRLPQTGDDELREVVRALARRAAREDHARESQQQPAVPEQAEP